MNQKDYKAIAVIIKNNLYPERICDRRFIFDLSHYFEREAPYISSLHPEREFNRKQFLKEAGVK